MRAWLCVSMFVFLSAASQAQKATQVETPVQIELQPGQQLFPSVAPDKTIAFSQRNGADWDLYVLRHASPPTNLTADSAADDWQAEFSPDGKWLAFRSERNGGGIYIMNPDGKNLRRLTSAGFNPTWSPDGSEVAYSTAQVIADPAFRPIRGTLFAIKVATGERRILWALSDAVQPRWSPNGRRIAFWGFASQGGQRDIWTITSAGTDPVKVTDDAATDWNPVWSPDGNYLYFGSDRGGTMEIWRIPIDQTAGRPKGPPTQITTGGKGIRGHIAFDFAELGLRHGSEHPGCHARSAGPRLVALEHHDRHPALRRPPGAREADHAGTDNCRVVAGPAGRFHHRPFAFWAGPRRSIAYAGITRIRFNGRRRPSRPLSPLASRAPVPGQWYCAPLG